MSGPRLFPSEEEEAARLSVCVEVVLLAVGSLFFLIGHSGWAWAPSLLAAFVAGMAGIAQVWLGRPGAYVRRPQ